MHHKLRFFESPRSQKSRPPTISKSIQSCSPIINWSKMLIGNTTPTVINGISYSIKRWVYSRMASPTYSKWMKPDQFCTNRWLRSPQPERLSLRIYYGSLTALANGFNLDSCKSTIGHTHSQLWKTRIFRKSKQTENKSLHIEKLKCMRRPNRYQQSPKCWSTNC